MLRRSEGAWDEAAGAGTILFSAAHLEPPSAWCWSWRRSRGPHSAGGGSRPAPGHVRHPRGTGAAWQRIDGPPGTEQRHSAPIGHRVVDRSSPRHPRVLHESISGDVSPLVEGARRRRRPQPEVELEQPIARAIVTSRGPAVREWRRLCPLPMGCRCGRCIGGRWTFYSLALVVGGNFGWTRLVSWWRTLVSGGSMAGAIRSSRSSTVRSGARRAFRRAWRVAKPTAAS